MNVGKRCGAKGITQDQINARMIESARGGLVVVRLKSGDPGIFGRLAEELDALEGADVPFEVVPGITAGIAAAATSKAQAFLRKASRGGSGHLPPAAAKYIDALATLRTLRGVLASSLETYERVMNNEKALASLDFQSTAANQRLPAV